jgi:hypothetical protein
MAYMKAKLMGGSPGKVTRLYQPSKNGSAQPSQ